MKILFVLNIDLGLPGPSVHIFKDLVLAILGKGHEVTIIAKDYGQAGIYAEKFVSSIRLNIIPITVKFEKADWLKRFYFDVNYAKKCMKIYRQMCPDVVFLQSCNTAYYHVKYLRKHLKTKIVFNVQDVFPYNAMYAKNLPITYISFPILSNMQRYAYRRVDEIVTISEDMATLLRNDNIRNTPVSVIHNWGYQDGCGVINDSENILIKKYNIKSDAFRVVYAGNIGSVQNVEIIINAAIQLKNEHRIAFYLIGDGVNRKRLKETVQKENLQNVHFIPMQDESNARYIYSMADVNVIPLAKGVIKTALPSKTASCLSYGRCVIGCIEAESELGRILEETDGCYVVSNEDENELVQIILKLSKLPLRQGHITRESAMTVFSKTNNVSKYVEKVESLL